MRVSSQCPPKDLNGHDEFAVCSHYNSNIFGSVGEQTPNTISNNGIRLMGSI